MGESKKIVVIADGDPSVQEAAEKIAAHAAGLPGCSAALVCAENFSAADLLPACAFFIGCSEPKQASFLYIDDLFRHISLAGRPCGIFSASPGALKYLAGLALGSECALARPFRITGGAEGGEKLRDWAQGIVKGGQNGV